MPENDPRTAFPPRLLIRPDEPQYIRVDTHCAVIVDEDSDTNSDSQNLVLGDGVSYRLIDWSAVGEDQRVFPVYRNGAAAGVTTGKLFVRLHANILIEDFARQLMDLGYRLESSLSYAPHAGWVVSADDDVAQALQNVHKLAHIQPEFIEVQLLKSGRNL